MCGQNVDLLNVNHGSAYSNHWALKGEMRIGYAISVFSCVKL